MREVEMRKSTGGLALCQVSLLALLLLPMQIRADVYETIAAIQSTFSKGADPSVVLFVAVLALSAVGVLVALELWKSLSNDRKRSLMSLDLFRASCTEHGLSFFERSILETAIAEARVSNADAVLASPRIFEESREAYYKSRGGAAKVTEDVRAAFHSIRTKIGFSPLPVEIPFLVTRQFIPGMSMTIEDPHNGRAGDPVMVEEVNELFWCVGKPSFAVSKGKNVRLYLTRQGDAEYTIETEIDEVQTHRLVLRHTRDLQRKQLRNWVRVDVSLPVQVSHASEDGSEVVTLKGRIMDISGGGVALRIPQSPQVKRGSYLKLDFQLNESRLQDVDVEVNRDPKVLGGGETPMFQLSVTFRDIPKATQERIVRFVFERQRQDSQWR
jgi:c-di-GMP-binding flagellar brake protein YcgR